jgi:hypothetical protein
MSGSESKNPPLLGGKHYKWKDEGGITHKVLLLTLSNYPKANSALIEYGVKNSAGNNTKKYFCKLVGASELF